ncbi:MAG: Na+/H+ antiporter NhaA [Rikenellaceae bacterium]
MLLHLSKYSWVRSRFLATERARQFIHQPWAGGVVLLVCVIVAMIFANMEWSAHIYHELLTTDISLFMHGHDGEFSLLYPRDMNIEKFVNDGLMVLFFFGVGLEIKREVMHGELQSFQKSILPILAAVGGMVVPAVIYTIVNGGTPAQMGWGVPMATDIAFAIGILAMLGSRVPTSLKVFLTALAVADDLGAIIVIAMFYGGTINYTYLFLAVLIMVFVYIMNRLGERQIIYYIVPAIIVWSLFYYSGVHATMSGVAMAMLIPTEPRFSKQYFLRHAESLNKKIEHVVKVDDSVDDEHYYEMLRDMKGLTNGSVSMSARLEESLAPYVTFLVMPIFALVNGGVSINADHLNIFSYSDQMGSIGMGVFLGLVVGKPVGIFIMSWLAVKLKLASMPSGATWGMLFAVACLGGIGFTMSIFVDTLAFFPDMDSVDQGKIAILAGSFVAAMLGVVLIFLFSRKAEELTE